MAFFHNIGSCGPLKAELWGLLKGLMLAWLMGCKKVILKVDYEVVVRWMQEETIPKVLMADLIHMCKNKVYKQWKFPLNIFIGKLIVRQTC